MRGEEMKQQVRLVKRAKAGSKEALLQLIMAQKDDFYRLAYTYMGNEHDAMDAMEDMIVTLYEKVEQLKDDEAFYSWSKTILVNTCKKALEKRKRLVLVDDQYSPHFEGSNVHSVAVSGYEKREQQIDIHASLKVLNDQQREAIELKYLHDLDIQSIATITNVPAGTVKSRIFNGLKRLRAQYWRYENE